MSENALHWAHIIFHSAICPTASDTPPPHTLFFFRRSLEIPLTPHFEANAGTSHVKHTGPEKIRRNSRLFERRKRLQRVDVLYQEVSDESSCLDLVGTDPKT